MPLNFPEIWEKRVRLNLNKNAAATFLDGIPELDVDVSTMGPDQQVKATLSISRYPTLNLKY